MSYLALILLVAGAATAAKASEIDDAAARDFELADVFSEYEMTRTIDGFNSTTVLTVVAVGAVLVLLVGVGLYLYDYYADTSRTEDLDGGAVYADYYQNTYNNAEQAYAAPNQQRYRYIHPLPIPPAKFALFFPCTHKVLVIIS